MAVPWMLAFGASDKMLVASGVSMMTLAVHEEAVPSCFVGWATVGVTIGLSPMTFCLVSNDDTEDKENSSIPLERHFPKTHRAGIAA